MTRATWSGMISKFETAKKEIAKFGCVSIMDTTTRVNVALIKAGYVTVQLPSGSLAYAEEAVAKVRGWTLVAQ